MDWSVLYIVATLLILPAFIYGGISQAAATSTFDKYAKQTTNNNIQANELARKLLQSANLNNVAVVDIDGKLTDCYDPRNKVVKLSKATYNSNSIAAFGVCAHEVGHAIQDANKNFLFRLRRAIVPVINFITRLYIPMILFGSILSFALYIEAIGYYLCWAAVIMYGASFIFYLITLPLEYDASKKALKLLKQTELFTSGEIDSANKVLKAAIQTYISTLLTTMLFFLRFLSYAMIFSDRK